MTPTPQRPEIRWKRNKIQCFTRKAVLLVPVYFLTWSSLLFDDRRPMLWCCLSWHYSICVCLITTRQWQFRTDFALRAFLSKVRLQASVRKIGHWNTWMIMPDYRLCWCLYHIWVHWSPKSSGQHAGTYDLIYARMICMQTYMVITATCRGFRLRDHNCHKVTQWALWFSQDCSVVDRTQHHFSWLKLLSHTCIWWNKYTT